MWTKYASKSLIFDGMVADFYDVFCHCWLFERACCVWYLQLRLHLRLQNLSLCLKTNLRATYYLLRELSTVCHSLDKSFNAHICCVSQPSHTTKVQICQEHPHLLRKSLVQIAPLLMSSSKSKLTSCMIVPKWQLVTVKNNYCTTTTQSNFVVITHNNVWVRFRH